MNHIINITSKNKLSANLQNLTQRSMHLKFNLSNYLPNLSIFGEEMMNMKQKLTETEYFTIAQ